MDLPVARLATDIPQAEGQWLARYSTQEPTKTSCTVCAAAANGKHYGAVSCRACAAFFLRTVTSIKPHRCICRGGSIKQSVAKCQQCRFNRCLQAGMNPSEVKTIQNYKSSDRSICLDDLVKCFNRAFVTRRYYLHELGGDCFAGSLACKATDDRAYSAEIFVLRDFLSDYSRISRYMKRGIPTIQISKHFFPIWSKAQEVLATARNCQAETDIVCLNDAVMRITFDGLKYFLHDHQIKNPEEVATMCLDKFERIIRLAKQVRRAGLDIMEAAAFIKLLIAYYEKDLFASHELHQEYVDRIFRELNDHYKTTYNDYAARLGVLMALLGEFHAMILAVGEALVIVDLYSMDNPTWDGVSVLKDYRVIHKFRNSLKFS